LAEIGEVLLTGLLTAAAGPEVRALGCRLEIFAATSRSSM